MDKIDKKTRSKVMASIRSHNNKSTEWRFRSLLIRTGIRGWKVRANDVYGNPDFIFPEIMLAVFIDGCFWHGCPKCYRRPASNQDYWDGKVKRNKEKDEKISRKLRYTGWSVVRVWEHSLNDSSKVLSRVTRAIENASKNKTNK